MLDFLIPVVMIVIGVLIVLVFTRVFISAYTKTPANRAFVRTGGLFRKPNAPAQSGDERRRLGFPHDPRIDLGRSGHDGDRD